MVVAYILSMPGVGSWNRRWSGEDKLFCKVKSGTSKKFKESATKILGYHRYRWDDGWCVSVEVKEVTASEAAKLRRKSSGFCGYDWMISSLERLGYIIAPHEEMLLDSQKEGTKDE